jgi:hypothetical protein
MGEKTAKAVGWLFFIWVATLPCLGFLAPPLFFYLWVAAFVLTAFVTLVIIRVFYGLPDYSEAWRKPGFAWDFSEYRTALSDMVEGEE